MPLRRWAKCSAPDALLECLYDGTPYQPTVAEIDWRAVAMLLLKKNCIIFHGFFSGRHLVQVIESIRYGGRIDNILQTQFGDETAWRILQTIRLDIIGYQVNNPRQSRIRRITIKRRYDCRIEGETRTWRRPAISYRFVAGIGVAEGIFHRRGGSKHHGTSIG